MPARIKYDQSYWRNTGRRPQREDISPYRARQEAEKLMRDERGSQAQRQLIETLSIAGVLTAGQIDRIMGLQPRTLQYYQHNHLLDRVPLTDPGLQTLFPEDQRTQLRVYQLGRVGYEAAKIIHGANKSRVSGVVRGRILHDLSVNEVALAVGQLAHRNGWDVVWVSGREAQVKNEANCPILEPDAFLRLERGTETRNLLIEFHAESTPARTGDKVVKYDNVYRSGHWMKAWGCQDMPAVLVVFMHKAVGKGYFEHFKANRTTVSTHFYGKSWEELRNATREDPLGRWFHMNRLEYETLFEEPDGFDADGAETPPPSDDSGDGPPPATGETSSLHGW